MTHAKYLVLALATGLVLAGTACAAMGDASSLADGNRKTAPTKGAENEPSKGGFDSPGAANSPGGPAATGVVLVHAASFPSFRLCFEKLPERAPQPDSKIMPEANVVGVEIGSLVRIDPLPADMGKIYVLSESDIRDGTGAADAPTCGELVGLTKKTTRTLTLDNDYHVINTPIATPLGENQVHVLAITGCGSQAFLNALDRVAEGETAPSGRCGAGYNSTRGNLQAQVVSLATTSEGATATKLPIQLFHMAPAIESFKGTTGTLAVKFGPLGNASQTLPTGPIYKGGPQESLTIDQSQQAVYGSVGFRIEVGAAAGPFAVDQSLASIQELSSPRELPTTYYRAASNYALLLLGDPTHKATLPGGGVNPDYNPRRAVHLLAVPVIDVSKLPAADAGSLQPLADGG